jgi:hypothetical protein
MRKGADWTDRLFTTVEVVLCVVPILVVAILWASVSASGADLTSTLRENPSMTVSFLAAMAQPLVAWMLRFVHDHHVDGDDGYALANLVGLFCGELLMQSLPGAVGCGLLMWRMWRGGAGELGEWKGRRGLGGVLADVSGAIVIIAIGALCAFCTWRIGA